ncbi:MAG: restriction endonuclease subunit S [Bacteroidetes bacterium SB0662_bin_6]|nr:restriction endonuclease subunit S [Bacteroidetes bacterium SB0668_bin_1]MYE05171.1 restriction endonuclease subunit S [Bacteroidetes bacterium SB0662_bin_6]
MGALQNFNKEWCKTTLGKVSTIKNGATPNTQIPRFWNGTIPWCTPTDITRTPGKYLTVTERYITEAGLQSCGASLLPRGSILLCSRATIGEVKIAASEICTNQGFKSLVVPTGTSNEFLYYLLSTLKSQMLGRAAGSTFLEIGKRDLESIAISMPREDEQRAIAEALSDVDGLLAALEALIAKKRAIKQAVMQQLLTGKSRLPGFSGEWERKQLGSALTVRHGRSQRYITGPDGKYPILASGGEIGRTDVSLYDKPSVLIGRKGTIDDPQYVSSPFWTVDTLFYTEIADGMSVKFLYYKFCMIPWRSYNEASGVPSLNSRTIENIEVNLPKSDEQHAIAAVLSDMDAEITALEGRRDKTHAFKQGMMQQLLTGRVRLVQPTYTTEDIVC